MTDVPKTELKRDRVKRKEAVDWVDKVIGYGIEMASWLEKGGEKIAMNEGWNIQCDKDIVLEESEEEVKSRAVDQLVEEKEI